AAAELVLPRREPVEPRADAVAVPPEVLAPEGAHVLVVPAQRHRGGPGLLALPAVLQLDGELVVPVHDHAGHDLDGLAGGALDRPAAPVHLRPDGDEDDAGPAGGG